MKSLQSKFVILITSALLSLALVVGGFSLWNTNRIAINDSEMMMNAVCEQQALKLDSQLLRIEQSVNTIYNYALGECKSTENFSDVNYIEEYTKSIKTLSWDIANNTEGAMAVYFRFNPELVGESTGGFFITKNNVGSEFIDDVPTDITKYSNDDVEHVGWFYQPVAAGKAIWMSPYYNKNIGVQMISYVIPFYYRGTLIGVIGMDIDFTMFVDLAQEAAVYKSGRANLIDMNNRNIYYRNQDDDKVTVHMAEITDFFYNDLAASNTNDEKLKNYLSDGITYKMAFQTVQNGMKYVLYAPVSEINAKRNELFTGIVFLTLAVLVLFIIFTVFVTRRMIRPLEELTEASQKLAEGRWDIEVNCKTNDEISTLTNSIKVMSDKLKAYVDEVNSLAYKDALTGVKNKTYYVEYIKNNLDSDDYAVVVFDVNDLKKTNDNYGHETGDALIIMACMHICNVFRHSPVFRIGGDEFVAILKGRDYENRRIVIKCFEEDMDKNKLEVEPFSVLSVAYGMSVHAEGMTYDEVFNNADQNMYEKKKEMKRLSDE